MGRLMVKAANFVMIQEVVIVRVESLSAANTVKGM